MCASLKVDSDDNYSCLYVMYFFSYQGHVTDYFGFPTRLRMNEFCLSGVFPLGWEMDVCMSLDDRKVTYNVWSHVLSCRTSFCRQHFSTEHIQRGSSFRVSSRYSGGVW